LTNQFPIESNFIALIADNLNAEISLGKKIFSMKKISFFFLLLVFALRYLYLSFYNIGSVTTVDEAVRWLAYTYLFVRMRRNPMVYGIKYQVFRNLTVKTQLKLI